MRAAPTFLCLFRSWAKCVKVIIGCIHAYILNSWVHSGYEKQGKGTYLNKTTKKKCVKCSSKKICDSLNTHLNINIQLSFPIHTFYLWKHTEVVPGLSVHLISRTRANILSH